MADSDIAISGIGSIAGGLFSLGSQIGSMAAQASAFKANEAYAHLAREREDNAVQRRVADLRAAGLSPVLAAGSAAQSMAPFHVEAMKVPDFGSPVTDMALRQAQLAQTAQQIKLNEQQIRNSKLDADLKDQIIDERAAQAGLKTHEMQLANDLAESINPLKIQHMANNIKIQEIDIVNKNLETKARELGINQQRLDIVAKTIQNRIAKTTQGDAMMESKLNLSIKQYLLEQAQNQYNLGQREQREHSWDRTFQQINDVISTLKNTAQTADAFKGLVTGKGNVTKNFILPGGE